MVRFTSFEPTNANIDWACYCFIRRSLIIRNSVSRASVSLLFAYSIFCPHLFKRSFCYILSLSLCPEKEKSVIMASKVLMGDINVESKNFTNLIFIESLSEEDKVCRYGRSHSTQTFSCDQILIFSRGDGCKISMRMGSKWAFYVSMALLLRKFCLFYFWNRVFKSCKRSIVWMDGWMGGRES